MNHPTIQPALNSVCNDFRDELRRIEVAHNAVPGHTQLRSVDYWDLWIRDDLDTASRLARQFASTRVQQMRQVWGVRTGSEAIQALQIINSLRSLGSDMDIDTRGLR